MGALLTRLIKNNSDRFLFKDHLYYTTLTRYINTCENEKK